MPTTANTTYTPLIGAVLRARARTRCPNLAIALRGERAAVVLRVPYADDRGRPTTFSHYVTPFCTPAFLEMVVDQTEHLTPDAIRAHIQVALSVARTAQRHTALVELLREYVQQEAAV